jgi:hypothetical protein
MKDIISRYRISIDTYSDVQKFLEAIKGYESNIQLVGDNDDGNIIVCGKEFLKSIISTLHTMSFKNLRCESDIDIYSRIKDFVINESRGV